VVSQAVVHGAWISHLLSHNETLEVDFEGQHYTSNDGRPVDGMHACLERKDA
jgi:hypothetical protein